MKKGIVLLIVLILGGVYWFKNDDYRLVGDLVEMKVGRAKLWVEVMDSAEERQQGLSGREELKDNEGMLFVFDEPGQYGFWMNGMKFDLDFIFIRDDRVVEIREGVKAPKKGEDPAVLTSEELAERVLEVRSGWVEEHEIKVGDRVR